MTINRDNYESLFLLAVDNELSKQERDMLGEFLNNNTDLKNEFYLLQKSIIPVQEVWYTRKLDLLKSTIISQETEEKILLFIDQELSEKEAVFFKIEMEADEKISTAVHILQKTKLSPDHKIIFDKKQLLFKKEGNKVLPFEWLKFAAAAVFIGAGVFGAIKYLPVFKSVSVIEIATKAAFTTDAVDMAEEISVTKKLPLKIKTATIKSVVEAKEAELLTLKLKKPAQVNIKIILPTELKLNKPNNNLPKPYYEESKMDDLSTLNKPIQSNTNQNFNNAPVIQLTELPNKVYTTSFTDNMDVDKNDHFTFTDEEEEPKKSFLSGFLRKAKRLLERTAKIKESTENLKVANFEFATQ